MIGSHAAEEVRGDVCFSLFFVGFFSRGGWYYSCGPPSSSWRCLELKVDHRREAPEHINQSQSHHPNGLGSLPAAVGFFSSESRCFDSGRTMQKRGFWIPLDASSSLQHWQIVIAAHGQTQALEISFKKGRKKSKISQKWRILSFTPSLPQLPRARRFPGITFLHFLHISREFPKMLRSESHCISIQLNLREEKKTSCNKKKQLSAAFLCRELQQVLSFLHFTIEL